MAQRSLRFGIHDGAGRRAATWKLWTETSGGKADVYLACRSLGGELKASLHESGKWHIAYSQAMFEKKVRGSIPKSTDRFIEKWPRPTDIAPGVTLAFRIITPWSSVTNSVERSGTRQVVWIPNAYEAEANEINIILVKPTTHGTGWPGKRGMGTSLVGSIQLESGETVWVVCRVIPSPDLSKYSGSVGHFYNGKNEKDLVGDGLRALVFGSEEDGSRVMYDYAVQKHSKEG